MPQSALLPRARLRITDATGLPVMPETPMLHSDHIATYACDARDTYVTHLCYTCLRVTDATGLPAYIPVVSSK